MKILIVHHQMKLYGGAELVVVRLTNYLQQRGHTVKILASSTAPHAEYEGLDIVTPDPEIEWRLWSIKTLPSIYRVYLALRELTARYIDDYDIVHPHNFPAVWAIPNNGKRPVWICNEVPDLWHNEKVSGIADKLFNAARYVDRKVVRSKNPVSIVADTRCAEIFKKRYGLDPEVIPYGIDGKFFATNGRSDHSDNGGRFQVICPSMVSPSKDQLSILKAVVRIKPYIKGIKVILSGYREVEHPYSIMLDNYIAKHRLDVTYVAPTSRDNLRDIYQASTVAVFAGKGQGSWLGAFEQMSAGVPVIVSPNLTCADIVRKNDIGLVTNDIASAIISVLRNYKKFKVQALKGREYVLNNLTWDKYGESVERVMEAAALQE